MRGQPCDVTRSTRRCPIGGHFAGNDLTCTLVREMWRIPGFNVHHTFQCGEISDPACVYLDSQVREVEYRVRVNKYVRRHLACLFHVGVIANLFQGFPWSNLNCDCDLATVAVDCFVQSRMDLLLVQKDTIPLNKSFAAR